VVDVNWKGLAAWVLAEAGVEERGGLVCIPYRRLDGDVHNWRVFTAAGRCWWSEAGKGLIPFGLERLPRSRLLCRRTGLLLCEGESDALACRQALAAFYADDHVDEYVVLGLPGSRTWRRQWRRYLEPFPLVYLLPDGDEAGRRMAAAVLADVPWARLVRLQDGDDCRSLLQREGPRSLDRYFDAADRVAHLDAAFRLASSIEEAERLLAATHGAGRG
jgi:hypothetical protein